MNRKLATTKTRLKRAERIRRMRDEGKDLTAIRASFKRLRLGELTSSEYHHALRNAGRPVGRPRKPKAPCARCVEIERRLRAWSRAGAVERGDYAALLTELQQLFSSRHTEVDHG